MSNPWSLLISVLPTALFQMNATTMTFIAGFIRHIMVSFFVVLGLEIVFPYVLRLSEKQGADLLESAGLTGKGPEASAMISPHSIFITKVT